MIIPLFKGIINQQGKFVPSGAISFVSYLNKFIGKRVIVTIYDDRNQRSLAQNSYLWGVVYKMISDETGHTNDELHEYYKAKLLTQHKELKDKESGKIERYVVIGETKTLNTIEFEEYVEGVRMLAALDHGLSIPLPNEVHITGELDGA